MSTSIRSFASHTAVFPKRDTKCVAFAVAVSSSCPLLGVVDPEMFHILTVADSWASRGAYVASVTVMVLFCPGLGLLCAIMLTKNPAICSGGKKPAGVFMLVGTIDTAPPARTITLAASWPCIPFTNVKEKDAAVSSGMSLVIDRTSVPCGWFHAAEVLRELADRLPDIGTLPEGVEAPSSPVMVKLVPCRRLAIVTNVTVSVLFAPTLAVD